MDALVLIFIWLCNLTARAIAAILRHILIFDSFVIALFTGFWLHMERGWGLVAVWMLGIVIFFALVALSAQKVTAIILSVIATAYGHYIVCNRNGFLDYFLGRDLARFVLFFSGTVRQ